MIYDDYRAQWLERERQADADLRAGVLPGGQRMPYRYAGPPLVHTPDAVIERAYVNSVQTRAHAWVTMLFHRALTIDDPPRPQGWELAAEAIRQAGNTALRPDLLERLGLAP